jgi:hypothetical protein
VNSILLQERHECDIGNLLVINTPEGMRHGGLWDTQRRRTGES